MIPDEGATVSKANYEAFVGPGPVPDDQVDTPAPESDSDPGQGSGPVEMF